MANRGEETDEGPGPLIAFPVDITEPAVSRPDSACAALIAGRNTIS
jgi:hypothetical protein